MYLGTCTASGCLRSIIAVINYSNTVRTGASHHALPLSVTAAATSKYTLAASPRCQLEGRCRPRPLCSKLAGSREAGITATPEEHEQLPQSTTTSVLRRVTTPPFPQPPLLPPPPPSRLHFCAVTHHGCVVVASSISLVCAATSLWNDSPQNESLRSKGCQPGAC